MLNSNPLGFIMLPVKKDSLLINTRQPAALFKNCRCTQVVFELSSQPDEEGNYMLPEFENCYFYHCDFTELGDNSSFILDGKNVFHNCIFKPTQKIRGYGLEAEFYGCTQVDYVFSTNTKEGENYNLICHSSKINFSKSSYVKKFPPVKMEISGGKYVLPEIDLEDWDIDAMGGEITFNSPSIFLGRSSFIGSTLKAIDELTVKKAVGCTIHFDGGSEEKAIIRGTILVSNEICNLVLTPGEGVMKKKLSYGAEISVANRQSMPGTANEVIGDIKTADHNFNGMTVSPIK